MFENTMNRFEANVGGKRRKKEKKKKKKRKENKRYNTFSVGESQET